MKPNLQLIQITKHPTNKNCWLAVEDYPQLVSQYSSLIQDYDFIDFEGEVFYYNLISELRVNDTKSFFKRYGKLKTLTNNEGLDELLKFLTGDSKQDLLSNFVEGKTVILLNY